MTRIFGNDRSLRGFEPLATSSLASKQPSISYGINPISLRRSFGKKELFTSALPFFIPRLSFEPQSRRENSHLALVQAPTRAVSSSNTTTSNSTESKRLADQSWMGIGRAGASNLTLAIKATLGLVARGVVRRCQRMISRGLRSSFEWVAG